MRTTGPPGSRHRSVIAIALVLPLLVVAALLLAGRTPRVEEGVAMPAAEANATVFGQSGVATLPALAVAAPGGSRAEIASDVDRDEAAGPLGPARAEAGAAASTNGNGASARAEARAARRILVSLDHRMLWLVEGRDTLLAAPVAIGMGKDFEFEGRRYRFATPRGERRVLAKVPNPIWTVPEWHYYEKAVKKGLEVVVLEAESKIELADGSWIVVQEDQVGRINKFGNFAAFTPGVEIIFDGRIFVPPMHTAQRKVPDALGPYKLDTGDGYLIHGTHMYTRDSIGEAASHGCVRMRNDDLERLYRMVDRGTPVIIF